MWKDNALSTSAEIAFFYSFALPALMIFLAMMAAIVNRHSDIGVVDGLRNLINHHAPPDTQPLFNSIVDRAVERTGGGLASFGVISSALLALWSLSNAIATLMRVTNRAYDVKDDRSFVERRVLSFGLALVVALTVSPAVILFFFGDYLGRFLADRLGAGHAFEIAWAVGRWPLAVLFIVVQLSILYAVLPNVEQSFRWTSIGSLVATLVWIIGAAGFAISLRLVDPRSVYGAFGSLLMLLGFLYMTGFSFLLGAEINGVLARTYDQEAASDLHQHPEKSVESKRLARGLERA
jgi:membrane protein